MDEDPRWQRFDGRTWFCATCAMPHSGISDFGFDRPAFWPADGPRSPNTAVARSTDFLSEDFCVIDGESFFVRCLLPIPLLRAGNRSFAFGVWSTLSEANFRLYVETFDGGRQDGLGPWFGWFSNHFTGYPDTMNLKCNVHPRGDRQRPLLELEPTDHPLAVDQRQGADFDRLTEIYRLIGHPLPE